MATRTQPAVGILPSVSVKDAAEALSIDKISDETCQAVAGDVEYRLNLVIQEAQKFMRHAKRTTMVPGDIDYALQALNVQPILHPPPPLHKPVFHPVFPSEAHSTPSQPQLYYLGDDEIDLASFLRSAHTTLPRPTVGGQTGVQWKAHWLAIEGVQPLISENPTSQLNQTAGRPARTAPTAGSSSTVGGPMVATETLARSHLSQEFQLVFRRLTEGLVPDPSLASFTPSSTQNPSDTTPATVTAATAQPTPQGNAATLSDSERIRTASLATLALDPSLAELVPYLIRWLAENISTAVLPGKQGRSVVEIGYLVDALIALVGNSTLFIEPYLHQLLPPILSVLLSIPLGRASPSDNSSSTAPATTTTSSSSTALAVRSKTATLLSSLVTTFSSSYHTLLPRLVTLLTRALASPPSIKAPIPSGLLGKQDMVSAAGRYEGALLGLRALGKETVRYVLLGRRTGSSGQTDPGIKALADKVVELDQEEQKSVIKTALDTMAVLEPATDDGTTPEGHDDDMETNIQESLDPLVGPLFASELTTQHRTLAKAVLDELNRAHE